METNHIQNEIGITIGSIIGYFTILAGIIMTILILEAIFMAK